MAWATVAVAGAGIAESEIKHLKAKSQDREAAAEGASLRRPMEQIPDEYFQNRNIAGQNAMGGLTAGEKQYAGEQRERGLATSLDALGETEAGPNDFAGLNEVFSDSLRSQSALDAQLHHQNIEFFTNANKDLAGQKTTQFGVNELQPYETKLKEIQDRRIAAQTNANNATDEALGYAEAGITSFNSRNPSNGKTNSGTDVKPSPYRRSFGLADTGGGDPGSPASTVSHIDPSVPDITNIAHLDNYWKPQVDINQ